MEVQQTLIKGLMIIRLTEFTDSRGFFLETQKNSVIEAALGRPHRFAQTNHSRSAANVLRSFHTESLDKLIYVANGTALFVAADLRPGSPTFGRHERIMMGDLPGERVRVFVSEGLSNAFYCFTEVDYINDVSQEFEKTKRAGVRWNDPTLAVEWPTATPIVSDADLRLPFLAELSADGAAQ
jgi:dTDP-4-dehydrorhamnose 3,5-epimerase